MKAFIKSPATKLVVICVVMFLSGMGFQKINNHSAETESKTQITELIYNNTLLELEKVSLESTVTILEMDNEIYKSTIVSLEEAAKFDSIMISYKSDMFDIAIEGIKTLSNIK